MGHNKARACESSGFNVLNSKMAQNGLLTQPLMTRERMDYAFKLYEGLGYKRIENYPPYKHMDDAICYAKDLPAISLTV